jgi:hypothetical protein
MARSKRSHASGSNSTFSAFATGFAMLMNFTCQTPDRFVRAAWLSLQPTGAISFGLADKTFISPQFRGRQFVFNAYNRVVAEYEISHDPSALEPVRDIHFTFHPIIYFHLKSTKAKSSEALFAGLCEVGMVLTSQVEMPWIRAISAPIAGLKSAGLGWTKVPNNDLPIPITDENTSLQIAVDFIRPLDITENKPDQNRWSFVHGEHAIRVEVNMLPPQISTLRWFHQA